MGAVFNGTVRLFRRNCDNPRRVRSPGGDKLLPGEEVAMKSGSRDVALHWVDVYAELSGFKAGLMDELVKQRLRVERDGQSEVESDKVMFKREADRLARRLRFWESEVSRLDR